MARWQRVCQERAEENRGIYPAHLPLPDLHDLIDRVDHILFPVLMGLRPFNPAHADWRTGKATNRLVYLNVRHQLAAAARNAVTAFLMQRPDIQTWKDNCYGPIYIAVAQTISDLAASNVNDLAAILEAAITATNADGTAAYIPMRRCAAWKEYLT
jgi:hypothetical protein